jgi:hypothetical protein
VVICGNEKKKMWKSNLQVGGKKKIKLVATRFPEMTWWLLSLKQEKKTLWKSSLQVGERKKKQLDGP